MAQVAKVAHDLDPIESKSVDMAKQQMLRAIEKDKFCSKLMIKFGYLLT